ncbi:MAG: CapA family protein [Clostridia bacterium]|nr:CapA family protein [Clostridia bacterium]
MKSKPCENKKLKLRERVLAYVVEHQRHGIILPVVLIVVLAAALVAFSFFENREARSGDVQMKAHSNADDSQVRISFAGDIMLSRNVEKRANKIGYGKLFAKMQDLWADSDIVVANLDTCVIEGEAEQYDRLKNKDVFFSTHRSNLAYLKEAGIDVLSLATDHIADYGRNTIRYAIDELEGLGIKHTGAGEDREKASEYALVEIKSGEKTVKVAIFGALGYYAQEYGAKAKRVVDATGRDPNAPMTWEEVQAQLQQEANSASASGDVSVSGDASASGVVIQDPWYDTAGTFSGGNQLFAENINNAREVADIIVVYMHWGDDKMFYESDEMRTLAHKYIDAGADMVIGSNPRVVLPVEIYRSNVKPGIIFYSIGSLVYDDAQSRSCDSVSVDLVLDEKGVLRAEVTPLRIDGCVPRETENELYVNRIFAALTKRLDESVYSRSGNKLTINFGE